MRGIGLPVGVALLASTAGAQAQPVGDVSIGLQTFYRPHEPYAADDDRRVTGVALGAAIGWQRGWLRVGVQFQAAYYVVYQRYFSLGSSTSVEYTGHNYFVGPFVEAVRA